MELNCGKKKETQGCENEIRTKIQKQMEKDQTVTDEPRDHGTSPVETTQKGPRATTKERTGKKTARNKRSEGERRNDWQPVFTNWWSEEGGNRRKWRSGSIKRNCKKKGSGGREVGEVL